MEPLAVEFEEKQYGRDGAAVSWGLYCVKTTYPRHTLQRFVAHEALQAVQNSGCMQPGQGLLAVGGLEMFCLLRQRELRC